MLISPLIRFLGIADHLPKRVHFLVQKFLIFACANSGLFFISNTFYVVFVQDLVSLPEFGLLTAISFIIQALLDYPTGTLGDWLGQRWILATAFFGYAISYWLLAFANSFETLISVYILTAIANSQQSGALQAWFDNNYKVAAGEADPERKIYQRFFGKYNMITGYVWALSILIGGLLATLLFREIVFIIQAIGLFIIGIISIFVIVDFPETQKAKRSVKNYFHILGNGFSFIFTKKFMLLFVIGTVIINSMWIIWGNIILFQMYFGYTGSDLGAGIVRFISWFNQSSSSNYAGKLSTKLSFKSWIPRLEFIIQTGYFLFFAGLLVIFPLTQSLNLVPIVLLLIIFAIFDFGVMVLDVLLRRFYLDVVPDNIRNSIYSLIPTLILIFSSPVIIFAGFFVEKYGFSTSLLLMACIGSIGALFIYFGMKSVPDSIINSKNEV